MVRESTIRKRRYEDSLHPGEIGKKFERLKPVMVEMESEYLAQIAQVEAKVKQLVEAAGIPSFQVAQYINVGRQCYSLAKRFSQATRDLEAQRVVDHWAARGLDGPLLAQACLAGGCHVTPPAAVCWNPCPHADRHAAIGSDPIVNALNLNAIPVHGSDKHDATVRLGRPRYLLPLWGPGNTGQVAAANRVTLHPVWVPRQVTVNQICFPLITGSSGKYYRLGIYADMEGTPVGGALLVDSGNKDAGTAGGKYTNIPSTVIPRGMAWVCIATQDAVMAWGRTALTYAFVNDNLTGCYYTMGAWGALTNPCPEVTAWSNGRPSIILRVASIDE